MCPELIKDIPSLRQAVQEARGRGLRVGLVPTMGALHAGHASLINAARRETGFVVVSIFVNPTQFGPNEDFSRYPRTLQEDIAICAAEGADLIFAPETAEVYPAGSCTFVEVAGLQDLLCGKSRPGHFRGVATVVLKLFNMVQPDAAYFGQKDAQQVRVIQQMVRDLNVPVEIRVCPIVREPDGLAISSRNKYLTAKQRANATVLHKALCAAERLVQSGQADVNVLRQAMIVTIREAPDAVVDYVEVVDPISLQPMLRVEKEAVAMLAIKFGDTRLIDNLLLKV